MSSVNNLISVQIDEEYDDDESERNTEEVLQIDVDQVDIDLRISTDFSTDMSCVTSVLDDNVSYSSNTLSKDRNTRSQTITSSCHSHTSSSVNSAKKDRGKSTNIVSSVIIVSHINEFFQLLHESTKQTVEGNNSSAGSLLDKVKSRQQLNIPNSSSMSVAKLMLVNNKSSKHKKKSSNRNDSNSQKRKISRSGSYISTQQIISNDLNSYTLWNLNPMQFAQQITLFTHSLIKDIPILEFIKMNFKSENLQSKFYILKLFTKRLISIMTTEILYITNIIQRVNNIIYFIYVAENCYKINNFETLSIIITCLESTSIYRLKNTWKLVEDKIPRKWMSLKSYVGIGGKNLEKIQLSARSPYIPVISSILKHLININEEPSYIVTHAGSDAGECDEMRLINFNKIRKSGMVSTSYYDIYNISY
jgi:hypothetical protein